MQILPTLKPHDSVEIIAPASLCSQPQLNGLKDLLTSWELNCIVKEDIFAPDLFCANSDEKRFDFLKNALLDPQIKAVICARGGYGSMRLIPQLNQISPPREPKLFVGMSDLTALNLFLQQKWHWPIVHGAASPDRFSVESINLVKALLFGEIESLQWQAEPLNDLAQQDNIIKSSVTGGNLCLVETSIGTLWEMDPTNKIILLEEVGEKAYRVDRMLEHLRQAGLFKNAKAIVFADFIIKDEAEIPLIEKTLLRFAKTIAIPVVKISGVGHDFTNFPIPLNTSAKLKLGIQPNLICFK